MWKELELARPVFYFIGTYLLILLTVKNSLDFFSKFIKPQWQMIKGLEGMAYEETLRELNVYSLKKHK